MKIIKVEQIQLMNLKITSIILIFICQISYGQAKNARTKLGVEYAKSELKEALSSNNERQILKLLLIRKPLLQFLKQFYLKFMERII